MGRRKRASAQKETKPTEAVVAVVRAPREAMRVALELAGGDRRRLIVEPDGSIVVLNQPR